MRRGRLSFFTLCLWLRACAALAAPPSEQTLACVSASTEGQIARDRGQLLAARAQFRACAQPGCPSIVKTSCAEWLVDLDRRIPSVVVRVSEPNERDINGASVLIDGAPVALDGRPVLLDPGAHDIVASAPGWQGSERTFLLAEREQARLLVIELQSPKAPGGAQPGAVEAPPLSSALATPGAQREQETPRGSARFRVPVASWILGGLGVAGIASFAVLRVEAGAEFSRLQKKCDQECLPARTERGRHYALAADLSLGIGVAAIAGAGAWALGSWLWREHRTTRIAWVPTYGGMFASVAGRY